MLNDAAIDKRTQSISPSCLMTPVFMVQVAARQVSRCRSGVRAQNIVTRALHCSIVWQLLVSFHCGKVLVDASSCYSAWLCFLLREIGLEHGKRAPAPDITTHSWVPEMQKARTGELPLRCNGIGGAWLHALQTNSLAHA